MKTLAFPDVRMPSGWSRSWSTLPLVPGFRSIEYGKVSEGVVERQLVEFCNIGALTTGTPETVGVGTLKARNIASP